MQRFYNEAGDVGLADVCSRAGYEKISAHMYISLCMWADFFSSTQIPLR